MALLRNESTLYLANESSFCCHFFENFYVRQVESSIGRGVPLELERGFFDIFIGLELVSLNS